MKTRKKIYGGLLMAAAALLCLAGCKKENEGEKVVLGTQFEKSVSAQKTYLGENNTVCWSAGDKVNVNGTEYTVAADGSVAVAENDNYYAVYPAEGNSVDENGGMVTLPASQTYTLENGKQVLNGPMAAHLDASSGILYFKNLYSLLKVTVSADDKDFTVSSITVTATGDNARALAGSYTFTFNGATTEDATSAPAVNPYAETLKDSSTKVSLACVSVQVSANSDKDFYLAVHPLVGQNLKVEVQGMLDGKSAIYTHTTATTVGLSRSRIGGLGINLQQLQPEVAYKFSVSSTLKVEFSPGNLYWDGSAFHFEESQWSTTPTSDGQWDANHVSHFFWSNTTDWQTSGKEPYAAEYSNSEQSLEEFFTEADGFQVSGETGTWRTLTDAEWAYLLGTSDNTRGGVNSTWWIYNMVKITDVGSAGVMGLIIYPDGVTAQPADLSTALTQNDKTVVNIAKADFEKLEALGCVFLPAAGYRDGTLVFNAGSNGVYWSSSYDDDSGNAYYLGFGSGDVYPSCNGARYYGHSVRLVKDVK